ncbi:MAG: gliding motility protein GldN [Flavobacteriia bacterium]|nr:MAG: gliding motility protein GldN [Flavobacteriia bacterium]
MNKIQLMFVAALLLFTEATMAQFNILNAKTPQEIGQKTPEQEAAGGDKPLDYGYVEDRDIFWKKVVWEYVDLNERMNLPLYYPIKNTNPSRKSLYNALIDGIKSGEITEVYEDSYFNTKISFEDIDKKLFRMDTIDAGYDIINADASADISDYVDKYKIEADLIDAFMVKGIWYVDKRQGEMKYRIIAIAPVAPDVQTLGRDELGEDLSEERFPLFWVFYPDARKVMHNQKVFNPKNSAFPISYDHLLNSHRFSSIIFKIENEYGDREVVDYVKGNSLFQVLESQRLKEQVRNKEIDLWNY